MSRRQAEEESTSNQYVDGWSQGGGTRQTAGDEDERRPGQDVVGGFYYRPPVGPHGSSGMGGPGSATSADPYRQGDMRRILGMLVNQGAILDLQRALVAAGLLNEDAMFGYIDSATQDAFEQVLTIANQHGMTWQDVLSQAGAAGGTYGSEGMGGAALSPTMIALPNREDLDAALERDVGMALTGERIDDDLRAVMTDSVLDALRTHQERQVQREMDLAGTGEGVAFVESAPDVNRLLEEQVRERAPQKVMNKQTRDAMEVWFEMIGEPL